MCLAYLMLAHSRVDKSSSYIYRIPLSKVDQILFNRLIKKTKNQPTTSKALKPFYILEKSRQRDIKSLVVAGS